MKSDERYLDLYAVMSDESDYLQTGSTAVRYASPEALVVACLAAVLLAFLNGFVGRLGERASDRSVREITQHLRRGEGQADPVAIVEAIRLLEPYLDVLRLSSSDEAQQEAAWIADELVVRGYSQTVAEATSAKLLKTLRDP